MAAQSCASPRTYVSCALCSSNTLGVGAVLWNRGKVAENCVRLQDPFNPDLKLKGTEVGYPGWDYFGLATTPEVSAHNL